MQRGLGLGGGHVGVEEQQQLTERQAIEDLIKTKPAEVAMLIKTWLSED